MMKKNCARVILIVYINILPMPRGQSIREPQMALNDNPHIQSNQYLSCSGMANEWTKFPPKTNESTGVCTAWIQPEGRKSVSPEKSQFAH